MMRENGQLLVVPMKTMDGCEKAGQKLVSSERFIKGKFKKLLEIYLLNVWRISDFINK